MVAIPVWHAPVAAAADQPAPIDNRATLQTRLDTLAQRAAPGVLGVMVLDLQTGAQWRVNANRAYPMMSVFKAPLGATVLSQIESGRLSFAQPVSISRSELRSGVSAIRDHFSGERMTFTVRQLLDAAVTHSDNTAADALVKLVGGPQVITAFLESHGVQGMHVDMDEGEVSRIFSGLGAASQPDAKETPAAQAQRLQRGYAAYLADPRNRTTPDAAVTFLHRLWDKKLLPAASTQYLLDLLYAQTVPSRLRSGLPADARLADKCGTSWTVNGMTAAYNDIGIFTLPDGRSMIIAAFLTGSSASQTEREAIFSSLAQAAADTLRFRANGVVAVKNP